ncbi:hypothetical protein [Kordia zhangzhouensis]|uniref:hypothetical protein n=1 Tax=Kordia zhangzhouensis TaxID=1620405 RepID=UPI00062919EF|nr:hypothetical protein [Kordia zhangzhouensis]
MKKHKKLKLNKINLAKFTNINELKGGADSAYCWTKPIKYCLLSDKDIDCSPQEPINLSLNGC